MENYKETGVNVPEKKFSTGVIQATIWKNQAIRKNGEAFAYRTISLCRRYSDKHGQWKSTSSFRRDDLPNAALVIQKAYEYIALKEKEAA